MKVLKFVKKSDICAVVIKRCNRFADLLGPDTISGEVSEECDHHINVIYPGRECSERFELILIIREDIIYRVTEHDLPAFSNIIGAEAIKDVAGKLSETDNIT